MAELSAGGAATFPRRCLGALAQTAIGGNILPPRETGELLDVVAPHEAEELADARHRVPQIPGRGVMGLGRLDAGACDVAPPLLVVGDERASPCDALWHRRLGNALGAPLSVGCVGDLCADGWAVRRAVGMVPMGQELTACAGQGHAPPPQVAGRAQRGGIDLGLREQPAAQPPSDLMGIDLVVFGLAAMDRLPRERMTEDKRHTWCSPAVCKPVPSQQACGSEDDRRAVGGQGFEKRLWGRCPITVQQRCASWVEDAHVPGAGVASDTTVKSRYAESALEGWPRVTKK